MRALLSSMLSPWQTGQLGYARVAEVPHEDALGFVMLVREGSGVMLQSRASLAVDLPAIAAKKPSVVLYADVASIDEALAAMNGPEVIVPRRTTFYGATEIGVVDPAGNVVLLAESRG